MNRKEFTDALNRIEAFVNKIPNTPEDERLSLLMEVNFDLRELRRLGKDGSHVKAAGLRLYPAIREYVLRPDDPHRKAVVTELATLRFYAKEVPE